jgi:hypothetical protein
VVAEWGYENKNYWQVIAGDNRFINGFNSDYASFDDVCHLVNKSNGSYETRFYVSNFDFFDNFTPYGNIPEFFKD